ncbi:Uncharacterized protein M6B38_244565 [Iris pallida]|uniref:Integrase catalytic domain-containing protein n=1 Tax=Iris pallida TaxID=29817 RepID=A0AAX6DI02_IRIPA|nr:Uncharacterized protein M6B38_244565 [Iris pallida]
MMNLDLIPKTSIDDEHKCEICVQAKHTRLPFKSVYRDSELLELIHSDVCDSNRVLTRGGRKYFVTFIDDHSKYCYTYLLRTEDEVLDRFKVYKSEAENQLDRKIKILRSDRGGEYTSNEMTNFCEEHGIIHEVTAPYSPQSNGVAERKNRTLLDMVNAMLLSSGAPDNLWGEALLSACYILNRIPSKTNDKTPYELWKGRTPRINYLKVWGCLAKVGIPEPKKRKIGPKTVDAVFIGYALDSNVNRFFVTHSEVNEISNSTIIEARDAVYFENIFPFKDRTPSSSSNPSLTPSTSSHDLVPSSQPEQVIEPRRSKRERIEKNLGGGFFTFLIEGDPSTYEEAISSPDAPFWKEAINNEYNSIMENNTWFLADLPLGSKPIGCKWIFKKKLRADGTIEKFKARLVAKGFTQKKELDYFDTYSPVARISSIRTLLALASIHDMLIHQMDVKTAFLNGDLEEEIYMEQPEDFIAKGQEKKVCRLVKSFYGLKQAPKQWHNKFDKVIIEFGFVPNKYDKCLYSKNTNKSCVILCLYVDDILILGSSLELINNTKNYLSNQFDMKDLGEANLILGMQVSKKKEGYTLSLAHSIEKMLRKFEYFDKKPALTPYDSNVVLKKNEGSPIEQHRYSQMIGSLMYITNRIRPDIAFAIGRLSRYTSNPNQSYWTALDRVFRYLKGTLDYKLHYTRHPDIIEGYSDANWVTDSHDVKSTTGYVFTLAGAAISWGSCKQTIIARSTMDSEMIALDTTCTEAEWLRNLIMHIPVSVHHIPAISINCDNKSVIELQSMIL